MLESQFKKILVERLEELFPDILILINESGYRVGIPDLTLLGRGKNGKPVWALLEVKISKRARIQPLQEYYIERAKAMGFGEIVYPENMEEVLCEIQRAFHSK